MVTHNCKQIEELILKSINEELKQHELNTINKHIEDCPSCKAFKVSFVKIKKNMQIDADPSLQPNPIIRKTIINQMQQKSSTRKNRLRNFLNTTRSIFEYRVPVYQAGLATIIIVFLITFGFDYIKPFEDKDKSTPVVIQNTGLPLNSEYIIENYPDLENQKVGVNVREDSILIGFIYTSM